jgi:hypothetical protein
MWGHIWYSVCGSPAVCRWREPVVSRFMGRNWLPTVPGIQDPNRTCFGYGCHIPRYSRGVVDAMCEEPRSCVNVGLLRLIRAHFFDTSVVTPQGYKSKQSPLRTLTSSRTISHCFLVFFLMPQKSGREKREIFWGIENVVSPSLSGHGGTRLDPFHGHTGASTEPHE